MTLAILATAMTAGCLVENPGAAGPTDGRSNVYMTPVERATATAEARDRKLPLIIGRQGGECDSGYTRVAFSKGVQEKMRRDISTKRRVEILMFNARLNRDKTMMCSSSTGELPTEYTLQIRTEHDLNYWNKVKPYIPITAPRNSTSIPEPTPTPGPPTPTPGPSPTPIPSPTPVKQCKVFEEILGYRVHWYEMEWRTCNPLPDEYCYLGQEATIYKNGIARPGILDGYIKCKSESDTIKPPISQGDNRMCPSNREYEHTLPTGYKAIRVSADPVPCP